MVEPISGSVISDAVAKVANQPMIGRSTTEIIKGKAGKITVYEDRFSLRLWEIGVVAGVGAFIYYTPRMLDMISDFWGVIPEIKVPDVAGEKPWEVRESWGELLEKIAGELGKPLEPWFPRSPELIEPP